MNRLGIWRQRSYPDLLSMSVGHLNCLCSTLHRCRDLATKAAAPVSLAQASQPAKTMSAMMSLSQLSAQPACAPSTSLRSSSVRGQQLNLAQRLPKQTLRRVVAAAETKEKEKAPAKKEKEDKGPFKAPALDPSTPSPIFGGSTGGLLRKAQVRVVLVLHHAAFNFGLADWLVANSGRGVLRDHLGRQEGADIRDAHRCAAAAIDFRCLQL